MENLGTVVPRFDFQSKPRKLFIFNKESQIKGGYRFPALFCAIILLTKVTSSLQNRALDCRFATHPPFGRCSATLPYLYINR